MWSQPPFRGENRLWASVNVRRIPQIVRQERGKYGYQERTTAIPWCFSRGTSLWFRKQLKDNTGARFAHHSLERLSDTCDQLPLYKRPKTSPNLCHNYSDINDISCQISRLGQSCASLTGALFYSVKREESKFIFSPDYINQPQIQQVDEISIYFKAIPHTPYYSSHRQTWQDRADRHLPIFFFLSPWRTWQDRADRHLPLFFSLSTPPQRETEAAAPPFFSLSAPPQSETEAAALPSDGPVRPVGVLMLTTKPKGEFKDHYNDSRLNESRKPKSIISAESKYIVQVYVQPPWIARCQQISNPSGFHTSAIIDVPIEKHSTYTMSLGETGYLGTTPKHPKGASFTAVNRVAGEGDIQMISEPPNKVKFWKQHTSTAVLGTTIIYLLSIIKVLLNANAQAVGTQPGGAEGAGAMASEASARSFPIPARVSVNSAMISLWITVKSVWVWVARVEMAFWELVDRDSRSACFRVNSCSTTVLTDWISESTVFFNT